MSTFETNADLKLAVIRKIKELYDPEIPVDIYELGLIYEINILPINNIHILMTLTSPSCPSAEFIPSEVEKKTKEIENIGEVQVEMTFEPPYHQDFMSEAAKLELGFM
jgi:FeS assembly SUF system protein